MKENRRKTVFYTMQLKFYVKYHGNSQGLILIYNSCVEISCYSDRVMQ